MKAMNTRLDNIVSAAAGAIAYVWQYVAKIDLPTDLASKVFTGVLTAFLGGAAGYIGKEIVRVAWDSLKLLFKNRKKTKQ